MERAGTAPTELPAGNEIGDPDRFCRQSAGSIRTTFRSGFGRRITAFRPRAFEINPLLSSSLSTRRLVMLLTEYFSASSFTVPAGWVVSGTASFDKDSSATVELLAGNGGLTFSKGSVEISGIITRLHSVSASLDSAAAAAVGTVRNTEAVTASLLDAEPGAAVDSIRSLVEKLQDPRGSIGMLITSDSLYNSLTRLSNDLDSLVRGIKKDPKKYIKISVF